jgi:hypothetical protein
MATNLGGRDRLDFKPDPLGFEQFGRELAGLLAEVILWSVEGDLAAAQKQPRCDRPVEAVGVDVGRRKEYASRFLE